MTFQSVVNSQPASGIPGEIYLDGAVDAVTLTLESNGVPNIIGRTAYTQTVEGIAEAGGAGTFVGILATPKMYATAGSGGNALAPTMTLPDYTDGQLISKTSGMWIYLGDAANIGDKIGFTTATGALVNWTGATPANTTAIAGAEVIRFADAAAGIALIKLSGQI